MILRRKDDNCINIYCDKLLTQYELDRQYKSWKYRFCVKCRRLTKNGRGTVGWKCIKCGKVMNTANRIGQYFCGRNCREGGRAAYSLKMYKIKRLASQIAKQGGIDKYKCKMTI